MVDIGRQPSCVRGVSGGVDPGPVGRCDDRRVPGTDSADAHAEVDRSDAHGASYALRRIIGRARMVR